ncbi:hypothetical protein OXX80_006598 [Metschnikowia pulcherrima]
MLISNVLFECDNVSVFKIPPGTVSLKKWDSAKIVWRGSIRLLEEEQTAASPESAPYSGLRLKLELYNKKGSAAVSDHFRTAGNVLSWAEVWFNPFSESDLDYKVGNDGADTIVMTPESSKYYKIVSQLPDTGYCPLRREEKGFLLQVALGLQFHDSFAASSFSESLAIYKRHFRNFQEKYSFNQKVASLGQTMQSALTLPSTDIGHIGFLDDDDDDDFGNFVGVSYD